MALSDLPDDVLLVIMRWVIASAVGGEWSGGRRGESRPTTADLGRIASRGAHTHNPRHQPNHQNSSLRASDLACLATQDRRLRAIVSGSTETWKPLAEKRWPLLATVLAAQVGGGAGHYADASASRRTSSSSASTSTSGSDSASDVTASSCTPWYRLYGARETAARLLPPAAAALSLSILDGVRVAAAAQRMVPGGPSSSMMTEQLMRCVYELGVLRDELTRRVRQQHHEQQRQKQTAAGAPLPPPLPKLPAAPDFDAADEALARRLSERPNAVFSWAYERNMVHVSAPGVAGVGSDERRRRRGALAYLVASFERLSAIAAASAPGGSPLCPSLAARLTREVERLDGHLAADAFQMQRGRAMVAGA